MGRYRKIHRALLIVLVLVIGVMVSMPQVSSAVTTEEQMANWPYPMYQGEELAEGAGVGEDVGREEGKPGHDSAGKGFFI